MKRMPILAEDWGETREQNYLLNRKNLDDMEKNVAFNAEVTERESLDLFELFNRLGRWAAEPVAILRDFYAECLERDLTMGQTWHLIEAQAAFFMAAIPVDISIVARVLLLGWFVSALCRCRKAMKQ